MLSWCCGAALATWAHAQSAAPGAPAAPSTAPAGATTSPTVSGTPIELDLVGRPMGQAGGTSVREKTPDMRGDFYPVPDRWRVGLPPDYVQNVRNNTVLNPYRQNVLKGDYPVIGQDTFLVTTLVSDTLFEARRLPVPSGVSSRNPLDFEFFGQGHQQVVNENIVLSIELFKGDTVYKPRDLELRITPVFNYNYVHVDELGLTKPDVREGHDRDDGHIGFQELFVEKHLEDLSVNYDFVTSTIGIQGFTSDFRGFLYSDNNLGLRISGSYDNFALQYNLAYFYQLDKDTNSGLNETFEFRNQHVIIANLFVQDSLHRFLKRDDWWAYGLTQGFFVAANLDYGGNGVELDDNDTIVRPAPIGTIKEKDVQAFYIGWGADGHIGRLNISTQLYQAFGRESFNPIADQPVTINAQFAAIELSYDLDWARVRGSFVYASGDSDPEDGKATGFDSIFENPNFAGGGFNFFTRQAVRLVGSGVNLTNRNGMLPDLRTSKEEGQANFVNPGLLLYNVGMDFDLTPKTKLVTNVSYLQFVTTDSLELLLGDNKIGRDIGIDISAGLQYRPFNTNNVIFTVGGAVLLPGQGFKDLYTDEALYSIFGAMTLTY